MSSLQAGEKPLVVEPRRSNVETTTVMPSSSSAGSWKQRLLRHPHQPGMCVAQGTSSVLVASPGPSSNFSNASTPSLRGAWVVQSTRRACNIPMAARKSRST